MWARYQNFDNSDILLGQNKQIRLHRTTYNNGNIDVIDKYINIIKGNTSITKKLK